MRHSASADFFYSATEGGVRIGTGATSQANGNGVIGQDTSITSAIIPPFQPNTQKPVVELGNWAFCNCYKLASVIVPNSVRRIGKYCFTGCAFQTITFLPTSKLEFINDNAFWHSNSLTSIVIPSSVIGIGNGCFSSCSNLKELYYTGQSLFTTNTTDVFLGTSLEFIYVPKNYKEITFCGFSKLTKVLIDEQKCQPSTLKQHISFLLSLFSLTLFLLCK